MRKKFTAEEVETLQKVAFNVQQQTGWRFGQCLFNALYDVDKEMADEVRGVPDIDPFFSNKNIPGFLSYITRGEGNVDQN